MRLYSMPTLISTCAYIRCNIKVKWKITVCANKRKFNLKKWQRQHTGMTFGLFDFKSAVVTATFESVSHRTSNVNSTAQLGQNSSQVQSWSKIIFSLLYQGSNLKSEIKFKINSRILHFFYDIFRIEWNQANSMRYKFVK